MQLPLVPGSDPAMTHDWRVIFTRWGMLDLDTAWAGFNRLAAWGSWASEPVRGSYGAGRMGASELARHLPDTENRMTYWPYLLAIVVGAGLTLQVGMNGTIGTAIGSPLLASVVNFIIGTVALGAVALASGARVAPGTAAAVPAWAWFGGLFGAAYVAAVTVLGPRLGAVALLALVLLGQMAAALVVDHFGVVGFPENAVTPSRLVGVVLLVAGVILVVRK